MAFDIFLVTEYNRSRTQSDKLSAFFVDKTHVMGQMFREECLYMPNNASAQKRQRQEQKRRLRNRMVKSVVKTNVTKARQAIASGVESEAAVRAAVSELDRAAKKGVIHRNNAARRKSRLMKQLNALETKTK